MSLASGTKLGPYEIVGPLGAGGMGEVYRAKDTRLAREVAVKVLPQDFLDDEERRIRFEREAKLLAALNHPNIASIYSFEEIPGSSLSSGSSSFHLLVMELAEGQTLAQQLLKGPLPLAQLLNVAVEIASALHAAHRKGIVHRDLKPANIMRTKAGVKLLDFGLAKAFEPRGFPLNTTLPTESLDHLTRTGVVLGTLPYMAPEQLEGKEADARTDIFAFGAVLHEMATGRRAFESSNEASLIAAIMSSEPPSISTIQPTNPPALERVVRSCLAKDPDERWQSAGDIAKELKWIAEGSATRAAALEGDAGGRSSRERFAWAVAALAVLLGVLSAFLSRRAQPPEELTRFTIMAPPGQSFFVQLALSPDSRRILFMLQDDGGRNSLAVRSLDSLEVRRLPGTEDARGMFWSPDGREIAFFSEGRLKRIGSQGGPAQTICESGSAFSGAWSREGTILFTKEFGAPIVAVPSTGGTPRPVTALDPATGDFAAAHPAFLPDGRHFVFVARNLDPEKTSIMLASLDSKDIRRLFHADSAAVFADPGTLLFARDNALFAWSFDPRSLKLVGEPAPVFEQVRYGTEDNTLSVSAVGNRVVYLPWSIRRRLVWVDRKGGELGTLGEMGGYEDVRVSPDGRNVAVTLRDPARGENQDIWVLDASRGTGARITSERTDELNPAWFPDGKHLVYVSDRFGFYDLYTRPANGGAEKVLVRTRQDKVLPSVSPDGRYLLTSNPEGANDTRVLSPLSERGDSLRLSADARFSEEHPEFSPDGRWTTFDSTESGQREVYVQPLSGGPKRQVSIGGGQMPVWNRNGSELFYAAKNGLLMSVALRLAVGRLDIAEPKPLFFLRLGVSGEVQFHRHPYDVSSDGQRFLVIRRAADAEPDGAILVTNWTAALGRSR